MYEYLEQRSVSKCVKYDILHLNLISRQKIPFIPELHQSHWDPRSAHTQQRCLPSATQTGGQWRSSHAGGGGCAGQSRAQIKPPE